MRESIIIIFNIYQLNNNFTNPLNNNFFCIKYQI